MLPNLGEELLRSLTECIQHKIHFCFVHYCRYVILSVTERLMKILNYSKGYKLCIILERKASPK